MRCSTGWTRVSGSAALVELGNGDRMNTPVHQGIITERMADAGFEVLLDYPFDTPTPELAKRVFSAMLLAESSDPAPVADNRADLR